MRLQYTDLHELAVVRLKSLNTSENEDGTEDEHGTETRAPPPRVLQCDLRKLFRHHIRKLRTTAPTESPCTYGYPERPVHYILKFIGVPLWHEDQLHLAEWQALQQLEFIHNLTLAITSRTV